MWAVGTRARRALRVALVACGLVLFAWAPVARAEEPTSLAPPRVAPLATEPRTPPPAPDLDAFVGRPLVRVEAVLDDARFRDVAAPTLRSVKPGEPFSPGIGRRALAEALAVGLFADGRVEVAREGVGVVLTVHLVPRKIVEAVRIDVAKGDGSLDLQEVLREVELGAGSEIVADQVPLHAARIEALLARRGFPSARVGIDTRPTDDPKRTVLVLDVAPGPPRRVEQRVLYPVRGQLALAGSAAKGYLVREGDRADEARLAEADLALETKLQAKGHHDARVSHDVVLWKGVVVLRVRVDYGPRYVVRYEGNAAFDASTLDDALEVDEETDRSPGHLAEKVRLYYVQHGHADVEVTASERGGPDGAERAVVLRIVERDKLRVARREYPCLDEARLSREKGVALRSASDVGHEIDAFLDEELPGDDLFKNVRPSSLDETLTGSREATRGTRPDPPDLSPRDVYAPETYGRAHEHVQELLRADGFLSASVGPVQVLRRACDARFLPSRCVPVERPVPPVTCRSREQGVPEPPPPLDAQDTCAPDPARGLRCEPSVRLRVPVQLGPRTTLWDVAFEGVHAFAPREIFRSAKLVLGEPASTARIDDARRKILEQYKEAGFAFAEVKYTLDYSSDRTRARARFLVSEGEQVVVRAIVVRGNAYTNRGAIERRLALENGGLYRASLVRKTEERVATLGTFSSVSVALENPTVPARSKTVVVTVVERPRQYTELAPGFSTGEGFRLSTEYGHRNLGGAGIQLTLRLQLAYLPTPFIIDPVARENYSRLGLDARLVTRGTTSLVFPDVGLGPLVRTGLDGIFVHDLQRDFYITKFAAVPNVTFRPLPDLTFGFSQSLEYNDVRIFRSGNIEEYLQAQLAAGRNITDLTRQLLLPDGQSYAIAQRFLVTWDRRDNSFNASRGTYFVSGLEHVDAYPIDDGAGGASGTRPEGHFLKLTETFGGYIPLPRGMRIASLTRVGTNFQLVRSSVTYPDRLFFLGGVDSMRGWTINSFVPQDDVDRIAEDVGKVIEDPNAPGQTIPDPARFTEASRPVRGGNLMVNERIELRIPIKGILETVVFGDLGNLWIDPTYPFTTGRFPVRAAIGTGLRVQTPVGPLAVDYGINVTRLRYEDFGALNFAIGLF